MDSLVAKADGEDKEVKEVKEAKVDGEDKEARVASLAVKADGEVKEDSKETPRTHSWEPLSSWVKADKEAKDGD